MSEIERPEPEATRCSHPQTKLEMLTEDIHRHIVSTLGNELFGQNHFRYFNGLAYSIRPVE